MAGRPPKNRYKKMLANGKLKITKDTVRLCDIVSEYPAPPEQFNDSLKALWNRTIENLKSYGVLKILDETVLASYCINYSRFLEIEKELQNEDFVVPSGLSGKAANPKILLSNKIQAQMIDACIQLGMTPMSRVRLQSMAMNAVEKKANVFKKIREER